MSKGGYIQIDKALASTHPDVAKIARVLGCERWAAIGALVTVWCLVDEHAEPGGDDGADAVLSVEAQDIEDLVGVPGVIEAMSSVGWAYAESGVVVFPGYAAKNPLRKVRQNKGKNAASMRWASKNGCQSDAQVMPVASTEHRFLDAQAMPTQTHTQTQKTSARARSLPKTERHPIEGEPGYDDAVKALHDWAAVSDAPWLSESQGGTRTTRELLAGLSVDRSAIGGQPVMSVIAEAARRAARGGTTMKGIKYAAKVLDSTLADWYRAGTIPDEVVSVQTARAAKDQVPRSAGVIERVIAESRKQGGLT